MDAGMNKHSVSIAPKETSRKVVCSKGFNLRYTEWKYYPVTCYGDKCWNPNCVVFGRRNPND